MPTLARRLATIAPPVAVLTLVLLTTACSSKAAEETPPPLPGRGGGAAAVPVTVATVGQQAVPLDIQIIGTVEPVQTVQVHSQITGALTSVNFTEGEDVTRGQVLFTLDRRPLEAALAQAEANLARDTAQAANARAQAARYQDLATRGIATKEQLDTTNAAATALGATVEADRAAIENAKVQLQYATITAPITGRTGALMVDMGSLVRANDATPLVVINQVSPVYVGFGIPESQLSELKRYMSKGPVAVTATLPGDTAGEAGRVTFVDNMVDRATGTIKIKGTFQNPGRRLWPGQFVNVNVTLTTTPNAVTIPSVAIQAGPSGPFVYVVTPAKIAEMRPVSIERAYGASSIVKSGVQPGETIVTDGQVRLTPGSRVSVKEAAAPKKATS